jgi:DNA polymerase-1
MAAHDKPLLLIDGSGYIFRAFFALPSLSSPTGVPTGAVYGVATMLDKTLRELAPEEVAVCFDTKAKTFRHERFAEYKANRPEPPDALIPQFPLIHQLVKLRGLPLLAIEGYEADDIIGTLVRQAEAEKRPVIIVSGDKDLMQLVSDRVKIYDPMKDKWIGPAEVQERFGVEPARVIDVLALSGDSSDNVPGVPGVGDKTARKLIEEHHTLEGVLAAADGIKGKLGEKIRANVEQARLSRELVTIKTDVPLPVDHRQLAPRDPDLEGLRAFYAQMGFQSMLDSLAPKSAIDRSRYETVLREPQLVEMIERLRRAGRFAFDTETTSIHPTQADLVGLSFCCDDDRAYYVPVGHTYLGAPPQLAAAKVCANLKPLLEDPHVAKYAQNGKYDLLVLERCGVKVQGLAGDTMIADYLLDPGRASHSLDTLAAHYLGHSTIKYGEVAGEGKNQKPFAEVSVEDATRYSAEDAHVTWLLTEKLEPPLRADEALWKLYQELELPLIDVLAAMERVGMAIDAAFFQQLSTEWDHRINQMVKGLHEAAGEVFNLNSPQQIAHVLFDKLQIKPTKKTKTGYSTDAAVLEALAEQGHDVPRRLLEYRTLAKIKSTYVDTLPKLINPHTGRIHSSFNQTIAATGRLSSSDPNLQNIPIRSPEGRRIRQGFIPAPGKVLLSADYSQIELRLAAHLSGDPHMIEAFHSGEDFHTRTAAEIMGVFPKLVTPEMRAAAKTVNFGVLYGMSAFRLGRDLGIGTKKAQEFIDDYFTRFAVLHKWLDEILNDARRRGYTATILGRRRPLPDLQSADNQVRSAAERAAINTPVQGSAADLIKLVMLQLHRRIERERLPMTMILQVHDELVFEVEQKAVPACTAVVREEMEQVMKLSVPIVVAVHTGANWMEAHG